MNSLLAVPASPPAKGCTSILEAVENPPAHAPCPMENIRAIRIDPVFSLREPPMEDTSCRCSKNAAFEAVSSLYFQAVL
jgi:hypothetical protein